MNNRTASSAEDVDVPARPSDRPADRRWAPEQMTDALRRYPNINDAERKELLDFLHEGPREEVVKATHVEGLEPRLIAFRRDHPEHFPGGFRSMLPLLLLLVVPLVALAWRFVGNG